MCVRTNINTRVRIADLSTYNATLTELTRKIFHSAWNIKQVQTIVFPFVAPRRFFHGLPHFDALKSI